MPSRGCVLCTACTVIALVPVGVAVGLGAGGMGFWTAAAGWAGAGILSLFTGACVLTVCWNPDMAYLLGISDGGPSGAAKDCMYDPDHPPAWDVAADAGEEEGDGGGVNCAEFYAEYHSHRITHLAAVRRRLARPVAEGGAGCSRFVYLFGDSTLDNKHWFFNGAQLKETQMHNPAFTATPVNGYDRVFATRRGRRGAPRMVKDVSYWLNRLAEERLGRAGALCTLMTSIEESTIADRDRAPGGLLVQDAFIRDHVTPRDFIIVSVGGNDIALGPTLRTVVNMLMLTRSPEWLIRCGCAPGFGYFVRLLHTRIQSLVTRLVAKRKPRAVLICMLYYLDEHTGGSWADGTLSRLGYDANPGKLQLIIRTLFHHIKRRGFVIPGVPDVVPVPMFKVLDGKTHADYEQRVEPSVQGGRKLASAFLDAILPFVHDAGVDGNGVGAGAGGGSAVLANAGGARA